MNAKNRLILTIVIVGGSALLALAALVRLVAPGALAGLDTLSPSLAQHVLADAPYAALGLAAGLAGAAIGLARRAASPAPVRVAAAIVAVVLLLLTPGGMIPVAGYTFAMVTLIGVVALAVLLVRRHPVWGLALIAVLAALATWAVVGMQAARLTENFVASLLEVLPGLILAVMHLVVAIALVVQVSANPQRTRGAVAAWVLRHRVAITIVAACCAVPYTFARASWLTPWPLLAPSGLDLAEKPMVLLTGLSLGAAMLAGGVLTLGLILPWGRRFPRWMAGAGGRPVPVALAAVPASVIAALFTAGGIDWLVSLTNGSLGDGSVAMFVEFMLVFPFWLWGPALGLATWGYVMDREDRAADVRTARTGDPVPAGR